jgi:hypothetical protein
MEPNKRPYFALKKAYDRVKCDYLHGCLSELGFASSWIQSVNGMCNMCEICRSDKWRID